MWGSLFLESSIQNNFNFGFSSSKSDILLHLSQWQYWWWFWFSLIWVAYFFIILNIITKRFSKFNPVLNTSLRSHGKWGDFLVAIIPLSWCGNILINSNFILRMIEWQNESSLFTLRIQGKQWYWVYKFDLNCAYSIISAPKNIGNNRWYFNVADETYIADSYAQAVSLASQLEYQQEYLFNLKKNLMNKTYLNKSIVNSNIHTSAFNCNNQINIPKFSLDKYNIYETLGIKRLFYNYYKKTTTVTTVIIDKYNIYETLGMQNHFDSKFYSFFKYTQPYYLNNKKFNYKYFFFNLNKELTYNFNINEINSSFNLIKLDNISDNTSNIYSIKSLKPIRLVKGFLNNHVITNLKNNTKNSLLFFDIIDNTSKTFDQKIYQVENFWGFRQKKYKRLTKFNTYDILKYDPVTLSKTSLVSIKDSYRGLYNGSISYRIPTENKNFKVNVMNNIVYISKYNNLVDLSLDKTYTQNKFQYNYSIFNYYKTLKNSRKREDILSVNLSKRLLRTKRTLVLPAHTNITVITNSYDVVHSWFIPGLGIKLDCVPGRSTHHTFYIDNVGFYYGQCAEICGRYHHHMPIRVCAIPFEHFLVWWQTRGFPRLSRLYKLV